MIVRAPDLDSRHELRKGARQRAARLLDQLRVVVDGKTSLDPVSRQSKAQPTISASEVEQTFAPEIPRELREHGEQDRYVRLLA
jgi:hypothetical protein